MDFGITIKPDIHIDRIVSLTQQAEASGFSYGWIFDSHVIWKEPFPLLTLMAASTQTMRLGTCVTNPAVRDVTVSASLFATLNLASRGRMQLGIGRGDSSRRVLGKKPTTLGKSRILRPRLPRSKCRKNRRPRWSPHKFPVGQRRNTSSLGRRIRPQSPTHRRPHRRRRHPPVRRSRSDRLVPGLRPRRRQRSRPRLQQVSGHGRRARLAFSRSQNGTRPCPLVPRPCLQPRDGPDLEIQARGVAALPHVLRQGPRRLRLPSPLRSGQRQRRFRQRRSHRPLLHHRPHRSPPRKSSKPCARSASRNSIFTSCAARKKIHWMCTRARFCRFMLGDCHAMIF